MVFFLMLEGILDVTFFLERWPGEEKVVCIIVNSFITQVSPEEDME